MSVQGARNWRHALVCLEMGDVKSCSSSGSFCEGGMYMGGIPVFRWDIHGEHCKPRRKLGCGGFKPAFCWVFFEVYMGYIGVMVG